MNIKELIEKKDELELKNLLLQMKIRENSYKHKLRLISAITFIVSFIAYGSTIMLSRDATLLITFSIMVVSFVLLILTNFFSEDYSTK